MRGKDGSGAEQEILDNRPKRVHGLVVAKTSGQTNVLVPQPHGGALLSNGPPPGTPRVAGPGRPASEIRKRLRGTFSERLDILEDIARNGEKSSDRLKALDLMAKYGLGAAKGYDEALVEALGKAVAEELSDEVWERIRAKWVTIIGLHVRGE